MCRVTQSEYHFMTDILLLLMLVTKRRFVKDKLLNYTHIPACRREQAESKARHLTDTILTYFPTFPLHPYMPLYIIF